MPKITRRQRHEAGYREPTSWDKFWVHMCEFSPRAGEGCEFGTYYEAWLEWGRTREQRITDCKAKNGLGTRPYAFWVWDHPEANAKRKPRDHDHTLLYRTGLLPRDEEAAIRAEERIEYLQLPPRPKAGAVVEFSTKGTDQK